MPGTTDVWVKHVDGFIWIVYIREMTLWAQSWFNMRLCFLSEPMGTMDYVIMHPASTREQENIALLTVSSSAVDSFEGQQHHLKSGEHSHCQTYNVLTCRDHSNLNVQILTNPNSSADADIYEESEKQREDLQAVTFDDLLSFACQVARGMEFLSSKNVRMQGHTLSSDEHIYNVAFWIF